MSRLGLLRADSIEGRRQKRVSSSKSGRHSPHSDKSDDGGEVSTHVVDFDEPSREAKADAK